MAKVFTASVSLIDTCFPDYLQDHHNREGEMLFGVTVDGAATWQQVKDGLAWEWDHSDVDADVADEDLEAMEAAVSAAIEEAFTGDMSELFDDSLETPGQDDEERPQAWFLITYEGEDPVR